MESTVCELCGKPATIKLDHLVWSCEERFIKFKIQKDYENSFRGENQGYAREEQGEI